MQREDIVVGQEYGYRKHDWSEVVKVTVVDVLVPPRSNEVSRDEWDAWFEAVRARITPGAAAVSTRGLSNYRTIVLVQCTTIHGPHTFAAMPRQICGLWAEVEAARLRDEQERKEVAQQLRSAWAEYDRIAALVDPVLKARGAGVRLTVSATSSDRTWRVPPMLVEMRVTDLLAVLGIDVNAPTAEQQEVRGLDPALDYGREHTLPWYAIWGLGTETPAANQATTYKENSRDQ